MFMATDKHVIYSAGSANINMLKTFYQ